jgi:glycerophosphoryl diester phosphodiesterase
MKFSHLTKILSPIILVSSLSIGVGLTISNCSFNNVQYVMHRGLSSRYFENTVDSFTAAGKTKST